MAVATGTEYEEEALEYGREPRTVTGELTTSETKTLGYTQHFIDGVLVDPATIRDVSGIVEPPTRDPVLSKNEGAESA